ncbi:MAG: hypothetical protein H6553_13410 [Chitinophagales bacterium]|nr:hypothetical protein [Chitinophagales bacterium]
MSIIQNILLYTMVIFYAFAGINHFKNPKFYINISPSFIPKPDVVNYIVGVIQIVLAIGVAIPTTRYIASNLIIAMLVVFLSVHITHLIYPPKMAEGKYWLLILRIPIQFLLIFWAYKVSQF